MQEEKVLTLEMINALKKPLPPEAIGQHPSKSFLSTIKAIYVVERLNDIFGIDGWTTTDEIIEKTDKMVIVKVTLTIPAYDIVKQAYGGNDNPDRGDAYKGAVTDALTKIGSYLYIGMDVFKGLGDNLPPIKNYGNRKSTTEVATENQKMWLINYVNANVPVNEREEAIDEINKMSKAQAMEKIRSLSAKK